MLLFIAIGTVEWCVILLIVAAAILAVSGRPKGLTPAIETFSEGTLIEAPSTGQPMIAVKSMADGSLRISRSCLPPGLRAASLAITIKGSEIAIEERLTAGNNSTSTDRTGYVPSLGQTSATANFTMRHLRRGQRYHLSYNSSATSSRATLTLRHTPGFTSEARLVQ